jgi:uncharacterized low-complexity protein
MKKTTKLAIIVSATGNPFGLTALASGYQLADADIKQKDGKCGEAKCGADKVKMKEAKCGADKMKDGSCGADKTKMKEAACGADKAKEGKCGGDKK